MGVRIQYKVLAVLLVALFFPAMISAYSVENARLTWNEFDVQTIAPDTDLPGTVVRFSLSSDFVRCWDERPLPVCKIQMQAVDGLPALLGTTLDIRDRCRRDGDAINCSTVAATLRTHDGAVSITPYIQVGTTRSTLSAVSLSLTIDNTTPTLASIRTGACATDGSVCYIAANVPSPVTITFSDTQTSFDWRLVFLGRDGATGSVRVSACDGAVCNAELITPCQDGQEFTLGITRMGAVSSREDAQNVIAPSTGQRVVCKTRGPVLSDLHLIADGIAGQAVSGGSIQATARVTGGVGEVSALVETHGILGENMTNHTTAGSCVAGDDEETRTCTWTLSPLAAGTFTLAFKAVDALGLYSAQEERVTVLFLTSVPVNTTLDLFTIVPGTFEPERLNRHALEVAARNFLPYPSYLPYTIQRKSAEASILNQEIVRCHYQAANATNWSLQYTLFALGTTSGSNRPESRVLYPDAEWNATNRLDLQVRADRQTLALADEFKVRCEIAMTVRNGNTIYSEPELENVSFTLRLRDSALGQPGARVAQKIEKAQKDIDSGWMKQVNKLEEKRQQLDKICTGAEEVIQISNTLADIQVVAAGFCATGVGSPVGETIANGIGVVQRPLEAILNPLWNGYFTTGGVESTPETITRGTTNLFLQTVAPAQMQQMRQMVEGGPMRIACRQINCRQTEDLKGDQGTVTEIRNKLATQAGDSASGSSSSTTSSQVRDAVVAEVLDGANVYDPERSLTGAIMNVCLGGIVYNLQKHVAIECGYVQCLKEQTAQSQNLAVCERKRAFEQCVEVVGVVEQLPIVNWFNNVMSNINNILQNLPAYATKVGVDVMCMRYQGPTSIQGDPCFDWVDVGCSFADSILETVDAGSQSSQARQGLRDPEAAAARVQLCKAAVDKSYTAVQGNRMTGEMSDESLRYAAFIRDAQARNIVEEDTTGVNRAVAEYMRYSGGQAPTGAQLLAPTSSWLPIMNEKGKTAGHYYAIEQNGQLVLYFSSSNKAPKETPKAGTFGYNILNTERVTTNLPSYMTADWLKEPSGVPDPANPAKELTNAELVEAKTLEGTGVPGDLQAWEDHVTERQQLISDYQYAQSISRAQNTAAKTAIDANNWDGAAQALGLACATPTACEAAVKNRYSCSDQATCATKAKDASTPDPRTSAQITENIQRMSHLTTAHVSQTVALNAIVDQQTAIESRRATTLQNLANNLPTDCLEECVGTIRLDGRTITFNSLEDLEHQAVADLDLELARLEVERATAATTLEIITQQQQELTADNMLLQRTVPLTPQQILQASEGQRQLLLTKIGLTTPEQRQAFESAYTAYKATLTACKDDADCKTTAQQEFETQHCGTQQAYCNAYEQNDLQSEQFKRATIKQNSQRLGSLLGQVATSVFGKEISKAVESISTQKLLGDVGFLKALDKYADPKKREQSICGQINEIDDNDDGAIYVPAPAGFTQVTGTFGAEVREYHNGTRTEYIYMVIAYLNNPRGNPDNAASIILTDKKTCAASTCPDEIDLTNDAKINLSSGASFSSGNGIAKTRIIYLPGEYGKLCVRFDTEFPIGSGKREYCRTVAEDIFDTDAPIPPAPQATGNAVTTSGNPGSEWV